LKKYEIYDQRFPDKHHNGWTPNLKLMGTVNAIDSDHAWKLARPMARFPVIYNHEDYLAALSEKNRLDRAES